MGGRGQQQLAKLMEGLLKVEGPGTRRRQPAAAAIKCRQSEGERTILPKQMQRGYSAHTRRLQLAHGHKL